MRSSAPPIFSVPARYALFAEFAKGVRSLQPTLHKNCAFATLQTRLAAPLWNCKFAVARHLGFTLRTAVQICAIFTAASLKDAFLLGIPLLNMGRERKFFFYMKFQTNLWIIWYKSFISLHGFCIFCYWKLIAVLPASFNYFYAVDYFFV